MATRNTEPQDLGRLTAIDESRLDAEVVLWGRFGVVGPRREYDRGSVIPVEDLDRKLGEPPANRLELHLIQAPTDRARLKRACTIDRVQPRVRAFAEVGDKVALFCERASGSVVQSGIDSSSTGFDGSQLLVLATELAGYLDRLHELEICGVQFAHSQLRIEDGYYSLAGFGHLLDANRTPEEDVRALIGFIREIGPTADLLKGATITTAQQLRAHLDALRKGEDRLNDFELPSELPFVGRLSALAKLESAISQAKIARPTVVVVKGDRGVGKSRLLREFVATHVQSPDLLVLTGAWQEQTGDTRSGLLGALEQLSKVLTRLDPDERDEVRRRINRATKNLGAILARSAPALGAVLRHAEELPQLELGGDFSRHTAVMADVLKELGTRQRPLLLVLDNVESIDANSAVVLEIIAQSQPAHYTLIVLGLRATASGQLPAFEYEQLDLAPLGLAEVGELLTQTLPGEIDDLGTVTQILWSAADGLPLALGATLRAWLERGQLLRGTDGIWRARKSLREKLLDHSNILDLFNLRLTGADASVRQTALQIAVLGTEVRAEHLAEFDGDVDDAVQGLQERGILIQTDAGMRFPHDTVRELVLESASDLERRRAHQHAANVLTKRSAPIAQIVYHRDLGFDGEHETPEAFEKLFRLHVEAGRDRLDIYDLERARWHLERALELSHDSEQRSLAAEGLADICLLQEDIDAAVALYTAIIATATPAVAVRVAAKAVQFLFSKSANADAKMLGMMALEMAAEPTPNTPVGKLWVLFGSLARSWFGECKLEFELREGLCRLYMYMLYICLIDDPISVPMYAARAHWVSGGLRAGAAAISRSLEGALVAVLGWVNYADQTFALSNEIAQESKDAWAQGMVFHHWGGALLGIDRYSEGQDRLDDAIAAFRETGDVSIALVAMFYKALYGRDRESADRVLGWIEEALTTARRNGKRSGVPPLQTLKLHILARQGQTELRDRINEQAKVLKHDEMPGIERMVSHIQLAYAAIESDNLDLADPQVRAAQAYADEMGGTVPEFCQEVHLVSALFRLAGPLMSRIERKALRRSVRKFRAAMARAPRLRALGDLLELELALHSGNTNKARTYASKIATEFDSHENLHAARSAHRAMARLLKGENVLAAAEHERVARNLGRRLGLSEHILLSDFSELGQEVGIITLSEFNETNIEESQHNVPSVGMLSSTSTSSGAKRPADLQPFIDDQSDVLDAWDLSESSTSFATLGSIFAPVRSAVGSSVDVTRLDLVCPNPNLQVPIASGDLQILLINMLLACRDAVGPSMAASARLDDARISNVDDLERARLDQSGHYLVVSVSARGGGEQIPVIGAFSNCENLVRTLGGVLSASTDRGKASLTAHILLLDTPSAPVTTTPEMVIIVHSDANVRNTLAAGLDEIGVSHEIFNPAQFDVASASHAAVIFADGGTLQTLQLLQPLGESRLIELVRRGASPLADTNECLRVPFALSELQEIFRARP